MMTEEQQQAEDVPSHTNYPIYIRGTAVGLLEDTVPFWNVLPSSLEKINQKVTQRITKRDKYTVLDDKGRTLDVRVVTNTDGTQTVDIYNKAGQAIASKSRVTDVKNIRKFITNNYGTIKAFKEGTAATSKEARAAEMRSAMMTAGTSSRVAPSTKTNYEQFLSRLSASFPGVEVVTDAAEFKALIKDAYSNKLTTKDQKVYGVVSEGKVYLNPSLENYNTPIHEFGHIWLNTAKALNSEAYQVGMDLVPDDSPYVQQVKDSKNYQRVIRQMKKDGSSPQEINTYIREEALALAIGNKGESFAKAAEKRNFKNWLTDLFNFIKELTGISDLSSEQLQNLTLDEFAQAVVVDLLSQNELFAEAQEVGLSEDMQFMTGTDNGSMSMNDTIAFGRQNGYADAAIRKLLMDRGYAAEAIDTSMAEVIDLFSPTVPVEFGNVDGGMNVGKDIYADVYNQVEDFTNSSANPSFSKVRAKALELLRANPVFQSQSVEVQEQLTVALDKSMNIKANRDISQEISAIRNNIKQRRKGAQTLIQSKRVLSKFIRDNMPKSGIYSQGQINRLVNRVAKATESSLLADMEYVLGQVEIQNKKIKNKLIGKLASEVKSDAKKGKSSSSGKKARRGRLGADAQAFAAELTKVLSAATIADPVKRQAALDEIRVSLETEEAVKAIEKNSLQGFDNLTTKERRVVLKAMAFQEFQGINDMSLEQVKEIFKEYKDGQLAERTILAQTRATRAEANAKINQGITAQLKQLFPSFFNSDGQPLNKNEFNAKLKEARKIWRSGKGKGFNERGKNMILASKAYVQAFTSSNVGDVIKSSVRGVLHLGTFMETLGPEMKREVYSRLNKAESRYLKGYYNQIDSMDAMAQKYGFESYKLMRREIYSADELTLDNITRIRGKQDKNSNLATREENFTKDAVMRIYALSKNPVQRDKLARMGIDFDDPITAAKIENFLGQDMMSFVDETVNYLSNDYYEGVNNVYREVNDVNLNYISNYFPTQTIANGTDVNLLEGGDFMGIFDAEFANALKERVDTDNEIILDNAAFTTALEDHFQSMERFKAFAADTRTLNSIMTNEAVKTALDMTGTSNLVRQSINQAINPNSGKNAIYNDRALTLLSSVFVGIALGWKAVQIVKQATSAVLAIPDYTFRKDGKRMPGADLLLWLGDFAIVLAQGRKYVKFAKENSPSFRHRLEQGVKGDIVGLETGTRSTPTIRKKGILGSLMRFNERGSAFSTMVGDIAGVLGYMANYRRNVINGMDTETAIEKFEEYNSSQQSRNPADRSVMMQNQSAYTALLTMFGTAPMLMINNVVQSGINISRAVGKKKAPKLEDVRKFYMNFAGANVLFTAAGNFGKLWAGDDEDREEVYKKLLLASMGFNLLSFIPILGSAAEGVASWMMGDGFRLGEQGVTPVKGLIRNFKDVETGKDGALAAVKTGLSVAVRGDVNNFIGLFEFTEEMIEGTDEDILAMESFYEAMGIGGSSRPNFIADGILSAQGQREQDKKDARKKKKEEQDARRSNPARERKEELKKERENKRKYDQLPSE
jgi:hypothetical protein